MQDLSGSSRGVLSPNEAWVSVLAKHRLDVFIVYHVLDMV